MRALCFSLIRSLLIVVNLIATVLAALLVYVSFNAFDQSYELDSFSPSDSQSPRIIHTYVSILCAGLGLIICLLSVLGLVGALRKSKSLLTTYATIVFFMVSILVVMVVLTFTLTQSNLANREVDKSFVNSTVVVYNYVDTSDMKTKIIDNIQRSFSCCGINSPSDWTEYSLHKIPRSCCSEPVESSLPVFKYCADSDYKQGCWKALVDHFQANMNSVRAVFYVFIVFGIICITTTGFLVTTLRKSLDIV